MSETGTVPIQAVEEVQHTATAGAAAAPCGGCGWPPGR